MSEFKGYYTVEEMKSATEDPLFELYRAGFEKAREVFTRPLEQLAYITTALDHNRPGSFLNVEGFPRCQS